MKNTMSRDDSSRLSPSWRHYVCSRLKPGASIGWAAVAAVLATVINDMAHAGWTSAVVSVGLVVAWLGLVGWRATSKDSMVVIGSDLVVYNREAGGEPVRIPCSRVAYLVRMNRRDVAAFDTDDRGIGVCRLPWHDWKSVSAFARQVGVPMKDQKFVTVRGGGEIVVRFRCSVKAEGRLQVVSYEETVDDVVEIVHLDHLFPPGTTSQVFCRELTVTVPPGERSVAYLGIATGFECRLSARTIGRAAPKHKATRRPW